MATSCPAWATPATASSAPNNAPALFTSRHAPPCLARAALRGGLAVCSLLVLWAGVPTYALLFKDGFGPVFALSETLTRAVPLILTGLRRTVVLVARKAAYPQALMEPCRQGER